MRRSVGWSVKRRVAGGQRTNSFIFARARAMFRVCDSENAAEKNMGVSVQPNMSRITRIGELHPIAWSRTINCRHDYQIRNAANSTSIAVSSRFHCGPDRHQQIVVVFVVACAFNPSPCACDRMCTNICRPPRRLPRARNAHAHRCARYASVLHSAFCAPPKRSAATGTRISI